MIFPIGDDQVKGGFTPYFSYAFILLNGLVFAYEFTIDAGALNRLFDQFAATPREITNGKELYTLITSMFLHGGLMHLLGNMLFLWVFADNIEATIGNEQFLLFYLVGGLAAHAAHIGLDPASTIPTVGASGAISAVMGAYMVMFPKSSIRTLIFIIVIRIPAFFFLLFWIGQQFLNGTSSLQQMEGSDGVAWWAHIGGFLFGVLTGFYYRNNSAITRLG